jgi:hypothetical protein
MATWATWATAVDRSEVEEGLQLKGLQLSGLQLKGSQLSKAPLWSLERALACMQWYLVVSACMQL